MPHRLWGWAEKGDFSISVYGRIHIARSVAFWNRDLLYCAACHSHFSLSRNNTIHNAQHVVIRESEYVLLISALSFDPGGHTLLTRRNRYRDIPNANYWK